MSVPAFTAPSNLDGTAAVDYSVSLTWGPSVLEADVNSIVMVQAHTGTLLDAVGVAEMTVIGDGAPSTDEFIYGTHSFKNPGNTFLSDYLRLRHHTVSGSDLYLVFGDEFTMEGWFFFNTLPGNTSIFGVNFGSGSDALGITNLGRVSSVFDLGGAAAQTANGTITTGSWFHIAYTRDASDVIRIFVNGVLKASATNADSYGNIVADGSGGSFSRNDVGFGGSGGPIDMNGFFDQIRYSKACDYTADFTPATVPVGTEAPAYIVYRDGVEIDVAVGVEAYIDTTTLPFTTYEYQVAAAEFIGGDWVQASDLSNIFEITTAAIPVADVLTPIVGFDDERVFTGFLGGKLRGKVVAGPWRRVSKTKQS